MGTLLPEQFGASAVKQRALIGLSGLLLVGCASAPVPDSLIGHTWQVSNIYTEPGEPSGVSGTAAGAVHLVFGEASATGSTGCAPLQATVRFTADGHPSQADDATAVEFDSVTIRDPAHASVECVGTRAWTHDTMSTLLRDGHVFDITRPDPTGMVLTLRGSTIDRPALRLVTL